MRAQKSTKTTGQPKNQSRIKIQWRKKKEGEKGRKKRETGKELYLLRSYDENLGRVKKKAIKKKRIKPKVKKKKT